MSGVADKVAWIWPDSLDALRAAPQQHRLVLEHEPVRVPSLEIKSGP